MEFISFFFNRLQWTYSRQGSEITCVLDVFVGFASVVGVYVGVTNLGCHSALGKYRFFSLPKKFRMIGVMHALNRQHKPFMALAEVQDVLNAANAGAVCRPALPNT
jgi:hypothetical protein